MRINLQVLPSTLCGRCRDGIEIVLRSGKTMVSCGRGGISAPPGIKTCTRFDDQCKLSLHDMDCIAYVLELSPKGHIGFLTPDQFSKKHPIGSPSRSF